MNTEKTALPTPSTSPLNLVGQFLIAMPSQQGDAFERTVIYICEHNPSGALGLVVNRESDVTISDVLTKLAVVDEMPVHYASQTAYWWGGLFKQNGALCCTPLSSNTPPPYKSMTIWA